MFGSDYYVLRHEHLNEPGRGQCPDNLTISQSKRRWQNLDMTSEKKLSLIRDRPFNLNGGGGGGYGYLFRSEIFFRTTQELEYFFLSR